MTDELISQLVLDAAVTAQCLIGMPYEAMLIALYDIREQVKTSLLDRMPAEFATLAAELFVAAVAGHKAELEAERKH